MKPFSLLAAVCTLVLPGCTSSEGAWKTTASGWESQGWKQEAVLGKSGNFVMSAFSKSDTASVANAIWIHDGERHTNSYPQSAKSYLLLTFSKRDGDSFVVVMSKPK